MLLLLLCLEERKVGLLKHEQWSEKEREKKEEVLLTKREKSPIHATKKERNKKVSKSDT